MAFSPWPKPAHKEIRGGIGAPPAIHKFGSMKERSLLMFEADSESLDSNGPS
jgi:hypothetical protein